MNNYANMCFEAEKTGAIPKPKEDEPVMGYLSEVCKYKFCQGWGWGVIDGILARAWTCEELAAMVDKFGFRKMDGRWEVYSGPFTEQFFDTLQEALLFAVMYERGWLWTGEKFEKV